MKIEHNEPQLLTLDQLLPGEIYRSVAEGYYFIFTDTLDLVDLKTGDMHAASNAESFLHLLDATLVV